LCPFALWQRMRRQSSEIGKELSIQAPSQRSELWCTFPRRRAEPLSGTIDYPDQDTSGIQITAITYKEPTLHFESSSSLGSYDGTMKKDNSESRAPGSKAAHR